MSDLFIEMGKGWLLGVGIYTIGMIGLWIYLKWWSREKHHKIRRLKNDMYNLWL